MTAAFNPYDALGVSKDASPSDIKSAYRRRAKETHPDSGGSNAAFEAVNRAKLILLDDARRARFDQTGKADEGDTPSIDKQAMDVIAQLVAEALQEDLGPGIDLVQGMRGVIAERRKGVTDRIAQMTKSLKRAQKLKGRFRKKSQGENPIERMLDYNIKRIEEAIEAQSPAIALCDRVTELLKDFDFEVDLPPPAPAGQYQQVMLGGRTFVFRG